MTQDQSGGYRLEHSAGVKGQIQAIAEVADQAGKLSEFIAIMKKAVHLLGNDPHGWGDPAYRSAAVDAVVCHGILRPVRFRYVIYEQVKGVVLLDVRLFADFA
jgi:hypothetical protein